MFNHLLAPRSVDLEAPPRTLRGRLLRRLGYDPLGIRQRAALLELEVLEAETEADEWCTWCLQAEADVLALRELCASAAVGIDLAPSQQQADHLAEWRSAYRAMLTAEAVAGGVTS
jgi:hypothetical protein